MAKFVCEHSQVWHPVSEVTAAFCRMRSNKAAGPSGVVADMMKAGWSMCVMLWWRMARYRKTVVEVCWWMVIVYQGKEKEVRRETHENTGVAYPRKYISILPKEFSSYMEAFQPTQFLNLYTLGKGDAPTCGSYRNIKLLEHAMKILERFMEHGWRYSDSDISHACLA